MLQNLHTHTTRCGHATGSEEEYIKAAIEGGLEILGFSEHAPHIYLDGFRSKSHMQPEQLEDYANTVHSLAADYRDQIQILLGSEIEYYPALFKDTVSRLVDAGAQYLILGQHWIGNQVGYNFIGRPFDDEDSLKQYCKQAMEGMQTGLITYLCHPDVPNFTGEPKFYEKCMRELVQEANSCGLPIEYNLWGIDQGKRYPYEPFWNLAAEENCLVVLGVDAHRADLLSNKDLFAQAEKYIRGLGMELVDKFPIRRLQ